MGRIKFVLVEFISLVNKPANRRTLIAKGEEIRVIPIEKFDKEKRIAYGIAYVPDEVDTNGDYMTAEDIEKMAYDFMRRGNTENVDIQHDYKRRNQYICESWIVKENDPIFPNEKPGSWAIGIKVEDDDVWQKIKNGELNGISIAGIATKVEKQKKVEIMKPYPNEHSARVIDPKKFDQDFGFRRKKIADGIFIIIGRLKSDPESLKVESYRFEKNKFTASEAKKWLKDHGIEYISFEEAKEEVKKMEIIEKIKNLFKKEEKKDALSEIVDGYTKVIIDITKEEHSDDEINIAKDEFQKKLSEYIESFSKSYPETLKERIAKINQQIQELMNDLEVNGKQETEEKDSEKIEKAEKVEKMQETVENIMTKLNEFAERIEKIEKMPIGKQSIEKSYEEKKEEKIGWL